MQRFQSILSHMWSMQSTHFDFVRLYNYYPWKPWQFAFCTTVSLQHSSLVNRHTYVHITRYAMHQLQLSVLTGLVTNWSKYMAICSFISFIIYHTIQISIFNEFLFVFFCWDKHNLTFFFYLEYCNQCQSTCAYLFWSLYLITLKSYSHK